MNYKRPRNTVRTGPEAKGALRLRRYMEARGWMIKKLHGGKYQSGLPDLLCLHILHGLRWIETKAPKEKLRYSQEIFFAKMNKYGQKVYVLRDEKDYELLFQENDNWRQYRRLG